MLSQEKLFFRFYERKNEGPLKTAASSALSKKLLDSKRPACWYLSVWSLHVFLCKHGFSE